MTNRPILNDMKIYLADYKKSLGADVASEALNVGLIMLCFKVNNVML